MSLRVWLPLTEDLKNLGCSNPNITLASDNTWESSGKIGNGSLTLTKLQTILPNSSCMTGAKQLSYAFWVKVNTAWSTNWLDGIRWIETNGSTTHTARQEFYTNCTYVGTWYQGGSISGKKFTPGVWTHLAATIDYATGETKFYINGVLQGTATNADTNYACRGDFYIGDNGVDIDENDVRIYDHCLSAAEVREISQGLVLHYKLDNITNGIQDSSGYNHNGIIYGSNQLVSDSPRYSYAFSLTSTSSHINVSNLITSGFGNSYSFIWWAKSNSTTNMHWGFADGIRVNGLYNGNLWNTGDSSNNPLYIPGTTTKITVTEANVWHHWAMTGDGTTCKVYKDGIHVANAKTYKAISGTSLWFNGWQNATSYAASNLILSDFRLYATALDADAIRQLYEVGAKVDNKQNLHTFELIENNSKIQINKQGQTLCNELEEGTATKFYKTDEIIESNEFIEL